jgi:hypothetical protein
VPLAHHHGVERVALKVLAILVLGVLFRAVLVKGGMILLNIRSMRFALVFAMI